MQWILFSGYRWLVMLAVVNMAVGYGRGAIAQMTRDSARDVARVAIPVTVRVDNLLSLKDGGSGVIIARNGNTYTVLTAGHVVANPNINYSVYTSDGKWHSATLIQSLQPTEQDPDLAVVIFDSQRVYAVATLGDSDRLDVGSGIYISGYPQSVDNPNHRNHEFTTGYVTSRPSRRPLGYTIRHDALTRRGMSGAPVFDGTGRVVAIHGQGDRELVVVGASSTGVGSADIKTGFGAAIPINTFLRIAAQLGLDRSFVIAADRPQTRVLRQPSPSQPATNIPITGQSTPNQPAADDLVERTGASRDSKQPWGAICNACSN